MKLKYALIIGLLSSAMLTISVIAAESTTNPTPSKKEHKKLSLEEKISPKQSDEKAKRDGLNTLNSQASKTEKDFINF